MDPKLKNFDRGVEQMMNEHEVAPPFGMWNRISSELEAMPMPLAAAAPAVTAMIPKRVIAGIIAGVLILGASITTGYLVNSSINKNNCEATAKPMSAPVIAPANTTLAANVTTTAEPVKHNMMPVIPMVKEVKLNHITDDPIQATLQTAQMVKPTVIANNTAANSCLSAINNINTDVPTPIEPVSKIIQKQTFYFPPIDRPTMEKSKPSNESGVASKDHTETVATDESDAKASSGNGHRFRLRHRRPSWGYGIINRTK